MMKDGGDKDEMVVRDGDYLNWQRQERSLSIGNSWMEWKRGKT